MSELNLDEKILSLALNDAKLAMELTSSTATPYYTPKMQWLFTALEHYFTDPNVKSLPSRDMIEEYVSEAPGSEGFVGVFDRVKSATVDSNEFSWLLDKVKFRYNDKCQSDIASKIAELKAGNVLSRERIEEINKELKQSVADIDAIHKASLYTEGTLRDSAVTRAKRYQYIEDNPTAAQGILSGFATFDQITNGLHAGEFMIVAAETGAGKSVFMHNFAVNAYLGKNKAGTPGPWNDTGKNILYFSLEMPKETQERRLDSCMGEIYSNHIRDGLLDDEDKRKYFRTLNFQKEYQKNFHIVDMPKGATPRDIELKFIEISETMFVPDLVVVDYIGIMLPNDPTGSDWMDLGLVAAELHEFSRVYGVATITASQVNRPKADGPKKYDSSRIARSSAITSHANIILILANRDDEDLRDDLLVFCAKMRDGEKRQFSLTKDFGRMKLIDIVDDTFIDDSFGDDIV